MAGSEHGEHSKVNKMEDDSFLIPVPERKLICVEYPGRVVNVERALESLGGSESLSQTILQSGRRLALHFRPGDDFCKPLYGSKYSTTNMLLKVTRKNISKIASKPIQQNIDEETNEYACEVIGTVDTTFKFEGMCDFQYLPMASSADGSFKPIHGDLVPSSVEDSSFLKKDVPLFIMPGNFSRMDVPSGYLYQKQKSGPDPLLEENLIGKRRKRRPGLAYLVPFDVEVVPTEPQEEATQSVFRMKLKEELELLKKVLAKAKALIQPSHSNPVNILVNQQRRLNKGASVPSRVVEEEDESLPCFTPKILSDAKYILREDLLPAHYQMCYQFCDLHAAELKRIIGAADVNQTCDPRSGWWSAELCDQLRDKMSEIVETTVHKILAKEADESSLNQMEVDEEEEEDEDEGDDEEEEDDLSEGDQEDEESGPEAELLDYIEQPMDT